MLMFGKSINRLFFRIQGALPKREENPKKENDLSVRYLPAVQGLSIQGPRGLGLEEEVIQETIQQ